MRPKMRRPVSLGPRIRREKRTIEVMTGLYCRDHHDRNGTLCDQCADLVRYAHRRLDHCPFGESKYACLDCRIRCYTEDMAERTRQVMRYAGPRIWWRHPVLAFFHFLDGHVLHRPPGGRPSAGAASSGPGPAERPRRRQGAG